MCFICKNACFQYLSRNKNNKQGNSTTGKINKKYSSRDKCFTNQVRDGVRDGARKERVNIPHGIVRVDRRFAQSRITRKNKNNKTHVEQPIIGHVRPSVAVYWLKHNKDLSTIHVQSDTIAIFSTPSLPPPHTHNRLIRSANTVDCTRTEFVRLPLSGQNQRRHTERVVTFFSLCRLLYTITHN